METMEEVNGHVVMKGRRTKRQRFLPPAATSSTSSAEFSGCTTEEEEDMANCLILLAQGGRKPQPPPEYGGAAEKFTSRRFTEAATTTNGKAGFYVYECKTCNKCFPSFQALGGHRASHKKPKIPPPAPPPAKSATDEDGPHLTMNSFAGEGNVNGKTRIHECSICGAEFSSGQALGGHMRRHRSSDSKKERNVLSLDLNLPAPSEEPPAPFKQPLVFSVSALVDCHY